MSEYRPILERVGESFSAPDLTLDRVLRRRDRLRRDRRIAAGIVGVGIAIAVAIGGATLLRSAPTPAVDEPSLSPGPPRERPHRGLAGAARHLDPRPRRSDGRTGAPRRGSRAPQRRARMVPGRDTARLRRRRALSSAALDPVVRRVGAGSGDRKVRTDLDLLAVGVPRADRLVARRVTPRRLGRVPPSTSWTSRATGDRRWRRPASTTRSDSHPGRRTGRGSCTPSASAASRTMARPSCSRSRPTAPTSGCCSSVRSTERWIRTGHPTDHGSRTGTGAPTRRTTPRRRPRPRSPRSGSSTRTARTRPPCSSTGPARSVPARTSAASAGRRTGSRSPSSSPTTSTSSTRTGRTCGAERDLFPRNLGFALRPAWQPIPEGS